jgi:hypothetical protein
MDHQQANVELNKQLTKISIRRLLSAGGFEINLVGPKNFGNLFQRLLPKIIPIWKIA